MLRRKFCTRKVSGNKVCGGVITTITTEFPTRIEIDEFCNTCGKSSQLSQEVIEKKDVEIPSWWTESSWGDNP